MICLFRYINAMRIDSKGGEGWIRAIRRRTMNLRRGGRAEKRCHDGRSQTRVTYTNYKQKSVSPKPGIILICILSVALTPPSP